MPCHSSQYVVGRTSSDTYLRGVFFPARLGIPLAFVRLRALLEELKSASLPAGEKGGLCKLAA